MKTQLVVDAACDLPSSFLKERNICVLPVHIEIDGVGIIENRDENKTAEIYQNQSMTLEHFAESRPPTDKEIEKFFLEEVVPDCRFAFIQTTSKKRSDIYPNCMQAQLAIQTRTRAQLDAGERAYPFGMRVMNSENMFSGQGVLAAFTSDLFAAKKPMKEVLRIAEAFKTKIVGYALPADTSYVRERARKRGEDSISLFASIVAKSLDIKPIIQFKRDGTEVVKKGRGFDNMADALFTYAANRVERGLLCPYVIVSIAGNPDDLNRHESYRHLKFVAKNSNVKVLTCMMGLASGVNLGQDAIAIALAAEEHNFKD